MKILEKECEFCKNIFKPKEQSSRFCSVKCLNEWQKTVSWEDRIGKKRADEIRLQRKLQLTENNPHKNPEVKNKISASLKEYLSNKSHRTGTNNPFFGKNHTEEFKQKSRESKKGKWAYTEDQYKTLCEKTPKGENHPNWKGGISKIPHPYPIGWTKLLKQSIKDKFENKCFICSDMNKKLCIHHIDYDKHNLEKHNLVCLCNSCHSKTNYKRDEWQQYFQERLNNG